MTEEDKDAKQQQPDWLKIL